MIDGGFRENTFGAEYFTKQDFPENDYEVIWIEYCGQPNPDVMKNSKVNVVTLNRKGVYHSSYCFNRGIIESKGEIIVIPDADQIVKPDFLSRIWSLHAEYDKLVIYGYRYDEVEKGALKSFGFDELEKKCVMKNPTNYGGCLTVRKKWLLKVNGYEQHPIFQTGYHANGLDMYTRFKNIGLAIQHEPSLKLYHPWHFLTLTTDMRYLAQKKLIDWRKTYMQWQAFDGIDPSINFTPPDHINRLLEQEIKKLEGKTRGKIASILRKKLSPI